MSKRTEKRRGAEYEVGYGKPPIASRFRQGRSGNPTGARRGTRSAKDLLDQALDAPVLVNEGGKQVRMSRRSAIFKGLVVRAVKGDARATAQVFELMAKFNMLKADPVLRGLTIQFVDPKGKIIPPEEFEGDLPG